CFVLPCSLPRFLLLPAALDLVEHCTGGHVMYGFKSNTSCDVVMRSSPGKNP
ncbi:hypothetical protein E2562_014720, partial [Oryza meyeriana var. granulata]